jgi:hypothetical protein
VVQIVAFSAYLRPLSQPTQDKLNRLRARFNLPPLPNLAVALMPGDAIIAAWPEHTFGEYASALYAILDEEPKATLKDLGMPSTTPCARSASITSAWRRTSTTAADRRLEQRRRDPQRHRRADPARLLRSRHRQAMGRQLSAGVGPGTKSRQTLGQPPSSTP